VRAIGRSRGYQAFRSRADYQRFGCPDLGVTTSRFESLSPLLGPWAVDGSFVGFKALLDRLKAS
jgi:hypothetical protein